MEALLATASVEKGQATAKQCQACHTFEKGGPNRVGPNLWGIVGRPRARSAAGFNYSAAMKAKGGKWTFDELDKFLDQSARLYPRHGHDLRRLSRTSQQRADVIDFLHTLSDNPVPLPKAAEAAPPAGGAPAKPGRGAQAGGAGAARPRRRRSDVGHRAIVDAAGQSPAVLLCVARRRGRWYADRKTDIIARDCMTQRLSRAGALP